MSAGRAVPIARGNHGQLTTEEKPGGSAVLGGKKYNVKADNNHQETKKKQ
jgi:hypothetical protein